VAFRESEIDFGKIRKIIGTEGAVVHFVGIGGVSTYSLAVMTLRLGCTVTGSDLVDSSRLSRLRAAGAKITVGHSAESVRGASLAVFTHAVAEDNPELLLATELNIPTVSRATYLGALMLDYKKRIGVSGSHGKSTTTAMLDAVFSHAGKSVSVLSGADLPLGEPYRLSGNDYLVYEACEYRDSFLRFSPTLAIALNLEYDHTDYFADIRALRESFASALSRAKIAVVNYDDENLNKIIKKIKARVITFGQSASADYRYRVVGFFDGGHEIEISHSGFPVGRFRINLPGVFNAQNAAAAIVASLTMGLDAEKIREGLSSFHGIGRRLEHIGDRYARHVFYDYAHHPTEIRCAIDTVRMLYGDSVTVIFAPHTYSRTKSLWDGFIRSLSLADYVALLDIYPAREKPIEGISSRRLADEIGKKATYLSRDELMSYIDRHTYGAIIVMGAADMDEIKARIIE
jgi:UDP-N-acetylmuramate--alanine ligase